MGKGIPSESSEQIRLMTFMKWMHPKVLIFAIPNGGSRDAREGAKLKQEGVLAGVSDLFIAEPIGQYAGLFLEMKRIKQGQLNQKQRLFLREASERKYAIAVGRGYKDAYAKILKYLKGDHGGFEAAQAEIRNPRGKVAQL